MGSSSSFRGDMLKQSVKKIHVWSLVTLVKTGTWLQRSILTPIISPPSGLTKRGRNSFVCLNSEIVKSSHILNSCVRSLMSFNLPSPDPWITKPVQRYYLQVYVTDNYPQMNQMCKRMAYHTWCNTHSSIRTLSTDFVHPGRFVSNFQVKVFQKKRRELIVCDSCTTWGTPLIYKYDGDINLASNNSITRTLVQRTKNQLIVTLGKTLNRLVRTVH